jgi:hypothetical protein
VFPFLKPKSPSKLCEHTHEDANWPATVNSASYLSIEKDLGHLLVRRAELL